MRWAEEAMALARDNYGGRKGLRAAEVSLNSTLAFDSLWAKRRTAVLMSNDAKGCYDRIAHVIAVLALRRLGSPNMAIQSMIDAIQNLVHYIRTAFGNSESSYGPQENEPPLSGLLQGNGAAPAGWLAISSVLINIMRSEGYGLTCSNR